jgi:hypothetical protein
MLQEGRPAKDAAPEAIKRIQARKGSPASKFVHSAWTEEGSCWRKVLRRAGTWSRADSALLPTTERRRQSAGTSQCSGLLGAC